MQQANSNTNALSNGTPNGSMSSVNGETVTSSPLNDPLVAGGSVAVYANGGIMSITSTGSGAPTQTTAATPTALMASSIVSSVIPPQTSSAQSAAAMAAITAAAGDPSKSQPKRLHVSNIPFRFRDPDLRTMFGVSIDDSWSAPGRSCVCNVILDAVKVSDLNNFARVQLAGLQSLWELCRRRSTVLHTD